MIAGRSIVGCKCCKKYCVDPGSNPAQTYWRLNVQLSVDAPEICQLLWNGEFRLDFEHTMPDACSGGAAYQFRWFGFAPHPFSAIYRDITFLLRASSLPNQCPCLLIFDAESILNQYFITLAANESVWVGTSTSFSRCAQQGQVFDGITLERVDL